MEGLKQKRIDLNMSQKEVALKLDISESAVCRYEKNRRKPNIEVLKRYSEIFNCSIDELVNNV